MCRELFEELDPRRAAAAGLDAFRRYTLCDYGFKAVGVGSVGVFCAHRAFMSEDEQPLALQIKEAQASVLERFGVAKWEGAPGKRVTAGQRVMQAASDIFLASADERPTQAAASTCASSRRAGSARSRNC